MSAMTIFLIVISAVVALCVVLGTWCVMAIAGRESRMEEQFWKENNEDDRRD